MKKILPIIIAFILTFNSAVKAEDEVVLELSETTPYVASVSDDVNKEKSLKEKNINPADIKAMFDEHYKGSNFITVTDLNGENVLTNGFIGANELEGTNNMEIIVSGNDDQILVCSRLDNLGKGASGAAVQCLNIMMGIDETTGLV